jgi:ElaB/YqjD/DUF883 family membrane-anchored ribosome-binding protein
MPNSPTTSGSLTDQAKTLGRDAVDQVTSARDAVADMAGRAAGTIDQGRVAAADRLASAASAVRQSTDDLHEGGRVRTVAHAAADRLSSTADYMRTHDMNRMAEDVEGVVKSHPGPALLIAAAFGFLLGRAISRD